MNNTPFPHAKLGLSGFERSNGFKKERWELYGSMAYFGDDSVLSRFPGHNKKTHILRSRLCGA